MEMIMSTISSAPATAQGMAARFRGSGPVTILKSWWAAYLAWRMQRVAMIQLASMSDRELQDIGLTRNQIRRAVTGDRSDRRFSRYY
jgi:uncharacterized protein YjiS (DUF1127 family)